MSEGTVPRLDASSLRALATRPAAAERAACECAALCCPGWESLPGSFDEGLLEKIGTLVDEPAEPTLDEFHPDGTNYWSAEAPIAIGHFPYNRCEVWRCRRCARLFVRYTEYGGYYVDPRIREVDAVLIVEAGSTPR